MPPPRQPYELVIEALVIAVGDRDLATQAHLMRVQAYCLALARELGVTGVADLKALETAAILHDVGKISVPDGILNKPGRLTDAESELMKRHAAIGADMLSLINFPWPVEPLVRHHHENWDGTGYPDGLGGESIPLGSRILMVADCFDALTSDRPYRSRMSIAEAADVLLSRTETMYDPRVVAAFLTSEQIAQPALARRIH